MSRVLVLVVESSSKSDSDYTYIIELIKYYYKKTIYREAIRFVYMNGKNNYNSKKVLKEINKNIKLAKSYNVVYIFDKDNNSLDYIDKQFNSNVDKFCKMNKYNLVWFVKNIEYVFLGRSSKSKTKDAIAFKRNNMIVNVNKKILENPNPQSKYGSNILVVLDMIERENNN